METRPQYRNALVTIRRDTARAGALVEAARERTLQALAGEVIRADGDVLPGALAGLAAMGDAEVDGLHAGLMRGVLDEPGRGPDALTRAMAAPFMARCLERAGDHVTNIAEWIVYERTGYRVGMNP